VKACGELPDRQAKMYTAGFRMSEWNKAHSEAFWRRSFEKAGRYYFND